MNVKLYNTLTRKKEIFKPLKDKQVRLYTCGPTVYGQAHIGNLRTYIFEDVLKRVLIYGGYRVKHVMNITDIEDKIIKKMYTEKKTLKDVTEPFIEIFFDDLKSLNIKKADVYPKATQTIREIVRLISVLLRKGYAYRGEDGSIYFDVSKFKNYGRLSKLKQREIKIGVRVNVDEYMKKEASDFALWKAKKANEPSWPATFGPGRPGWHIECSAMSMKYLGKSFDIHCGAIDLIFPHHENEIAQSEAATGKKFVNYWIEGEHLLVDGKKMSKSLGNFYALDNIKKRGFDPLAFRYLVLMNHYRTQLNFTWKSIEASQNALDNLKNILLKKGNKTSANPLLCRQLEEKFTDAINEDLNMPKALAVLWQVIRHSKLSGGEKYRLISDFDKIFGLNLLKLEKISIPQEIKELVEKRNHLRQEKKWPEADEIRCQLEKMGWMVKDTNIGIGTEITKIK